MKQTLTASGLPDDDSYQYFVGGRGRGQPGGFMCRPALKREVYFIEKYINKIKNIHLT